MSPNSSQSKILSKPLLWSFALILPLSYFLVNAITSNIHIASCQIVFFVLPSIILNLIFKHMHFRKNLTIEQGLNILHVALITFLFSIGLNNLVEYWQTYFPAPPEYLKNFNALFHINQNYGLFRDIITLALIPAIGEELFFRGILATGFRHHYNERKTVLLIATIFALYHLNPSLLPFYFILGLFITAIYLRTDNIMLAITAHFVNNVFGVVMVHEMQGAM